MNIQLPVFAGFTNYAICRSDDPRMTSCYVVDTGFKTISDYLVSDGTYACLPFVPGHLYYMYRGNGKKVDQVKSFQSEVDLRAHLLDYYGTPWISGGQIVDWSLVFSMVSGHYDVLFKNDDESPTVLTYNIIKFSDVCSYDVCSIFFPNTYFRVLEAIQVSRIPEEKIPKMSQKVSSKMLW